MAVAIPPVNVWHGKEIIVTNMQEVAKYNHAWNTYMHLNPLQKENFKIALSLDIIVPYARVLEYSRPQVVPVQPKIQVQPPTPRPERIIGSTKNAISFKSWLVRQATLVQSHPKLQFYCGEAYELNDGTISVPISIYRNGSACQGTRFVFHFHRGASGPKVGHAFASKGHFKPYDGAPKHIRVEQHECNNNVLSPIYKEARVSLKSLSEL